MRYDHSNLGSFTRLRSDVGNPLHSRFLAIGEVRQWLQSGRSLPAGDLAFLDFWDLTQDILESIRPDIILATLVSRRFDCVDLAELLWNASYPGKLLAMTKDLPDPDIVRREVRDLYPGLDFDVVDSLATV